MRSASIDAVNARRAAQLAAMTPDARVALVIRLREEGLASFPSGFVFRFGSGFR